MTNGEDKANPKHFDQIGGLTKREHFANTAMMGMLAGAADAELSTDEIARASVDQADALIRALNYAPLHEVTDGQN